MKAKTLGGVGGCLLVVGLVVGLVPVSWGGTSCGAVMRPEDDLFLGLTAGRSVADGCDSLLSVVALPLWGLLGLGVLLLLAAAVRGVDA